MLFRAKTTICTKAEVPRLKMRDVRRSGGASGRGHLCQCSHLPSMSIHKLTHTKTGRKCLIMCVLIAAEGTTLCRKENSWKWTCTRKVVVVWLAKENHFKTKIEKHNLKSKLLLVNWKNEKKKWNHDFFYLTLKAKNWASITFFFFTQFAHLNRI